MSNEELVIQIQAGINTGENMLTLWQQVERFVKKIANRYTGYAEFEDLVQEGYFGISTAVEHWEQSEGVTFLSYAGHWVKQAMTRYIENSGTMRIPSHQYQRMLQYKKMVALFERNYDREPTVSEACHYLDISRQQYHLLQESMNRAAVGSLDRMLGNDGELTVGDTIASTEDMEDFVLTRVEQQELRETLWPLVDSLPDQQREVIRLRYQGSKTLKETGEEIGITPERVRQLQTVGFRELRRPKNSRRLTPFVEDYIQTRAFTGGAASFRRTWTSSTEFTALALAERYCL